MSNLHIITVFENCILEITCHNIISSSFFIKETIDDIDNIESICLKSELSLEPKIENALKFIVSQEFQSSLNKIILDEDEKEYQVSYELNDKGIEFITSLDEDVITQILLLLDYLDIKPLLIAVLQHVRKKHGNEYYNNLLADMRKRRYGIPLLFTKPLDKRKILAFKMVEFARNSILGHESGLYKVKDTINSENINLNNDTILPLVIFANENYFNQVYDSLVTGDDPYVNEKFEEMRSILPHSPVCLINIITNMSFNSHMKFNRKSLNIETYDKFMDSIREQLNSTLNEETVNSLANLLNHKCTGEEKAPKLAEGIKMFSVGPVD